MPSSSSSRIVFAEDLAEAVPWRPREVFGERRAGRDRAAGAEPAEPQTPPPPSYEDGLRDGRALGLEQAREESREAVRAEIEAVARRGDALLASLTAQLAQLQQSLSGEVVALAVEIARSAFGAALRVRDDAIAPAVVEALAAIVDERARPSIRLHPDDATLIGEQLAPLLAARGAQLVPDDTIAPGGCIVDTPRASVDATVQTRWRRALAALGIDDGWVDA